MKLACPRAMDYNKKEVPPLDRAQSRDRGGSEYLQIERRWCTYAA